MWCSFAPDAGYPRRPRLLIAAITLTPPGQVGSATRMMTPPPPGRPPFAARTRRTRHMTRLLRGVMSAVLLLPLVAVPSAHATADLQDTAVGKAKFTVTNT